jgi:ribosomal protein L7/L12
MRVTLQANGQNFSFSTTNVESVIAFARANNIVVILNHDETMGISLGMPALPAPAPAAPGRQQYMVYVRAIADSEVTRRNVQKIKAIKLLRETTGMSLMEAKHWIEEPGWKSIPKSLNYETAEHLINEFEKFGYDVTKNPPCDKLKL